ncbi:F-box protein At3g56470 [Elaeis guineensis]|uniref:Uncharacterized protein LOC105054631 n=1 Tax=Elaeis guineensis var. tenera TaxID=51953 RepID=A0A6I9RZH6_ELAGV|nr:uncharacterized protein LOC105054631 [Elaeis guineensis]
MEPPKQRRKLADQIDVRELNPRSPIPPFTRAFISLQTNSNSTNNEEEEEEEEEFESAELRNWSSLTDPLLHSVLRRLDTLEDFFAFRGVCRGWRSLAAPSSASLSSQPPLVLLARCPSYTEAFYDIARRRLYSLRPPWRLFSRFSIGYSHGFVITTTQPPLPKLLLWNLFTDAKIRLPKAPEPFDRVILSSNPSSPGCLAVLFSRSGSTVQYCHVGDHLWRLSCRNSPRASVIDWSVVEDMIFFKGKLYALTSTEQLVEVELFPLPKLTLPRAETGVAVKRGFGERWLAECGGELLMVYWSVRMVFDVYHWDFGRGRWVETSSLGGKALFMGSRGFAASIEPMCSEVRENCIYYAGNWKDQWFVYSLVDRSLEVVPAVSCGLLGGRTSLPPVWVFPSLC